MLQSTTIIEAKNVHLLKMFVDEQSLTTITIMVRMLAADWKQWAMDMVNWIQGMVELAFEKFVEQKWKDVWNIAVAEPAGWGASMPELKKMTTSCARSVRGKELARTVFAEAWTEHAPV